jgi:hypothetical protein
MTIYPTVQTHCALARDISYSGSQFKHPDIRQDRSKSHEGKAPSWPRDQGMSYIRHLYRQDGIGVCGLCYGTSDCAEKCAVINFSWYIFFFQLIDQFVKFMALCFKLTRRFNVFHVRALYYTKTLITNKCTKRMLSSIVTHSYMFRPYWVIFRENFFLIVTLRLHFIFEWECAVDCVLEAWTLCGPSLHCSAAVQDGILQILCRWILSPIF